MFIQHDSFGYRLLGRLVWRPYYWTIYRQAPELRMFMIRRRIWGGQRITAARRAQLAQLYGQLCESEGDAA